MLVQMSIACACSKKILRIVTSDNSIDHTEPIFKNLNLLKIEDLYKLKMWKFYFNVIKCTLTIFHIFYPNLIYGAIVIESEILNMYFSVQCSKMSLCEKDFITLSS